MTQNISHQSFPYKSQTSDAWFFVQLLYDVLIEKARTR